MVDYFEASSFSDIVTNLSNTGITVNVGTSDGTTYDVFKGSETSAYDMLDARLTYDLVFGNVDGYVTVDGISEINAHEIMAKLSDVDFIMVRDDYVDGATDHEQIYSQLHNDDIDFYADNSAMYGIHQIAGIGQLSSDLYGEGYDVMTSAVLETFGDMSDKRIFYDGKHSDFVDTYDRLLSTSEGTFEMALDVTGLDADVNKYGIGSNWEAEVAAKYAGGTDSSFYIDVNGKKVAVTFDGSGWKVDNTSLFIAQNAQDNLFFQILMRLVRWSLIDMILIILLVASLRIVFI